MKVRTAYNVGINDSPIPISWKEDGKTVWCPIYKTWAAMMQRCYSKQFQQKSPTYIGCSVDTRWHRFTDFKEWMIAQDWEGKQLDKDLLTQDNKVYGPDTCLFITNDVNTFITTRSRARGYYPLGVTYHNGNKKYVAQIGNGKGKPITLGYFNTPEEAHQRWYQEKRTLALQLASNQTDKRISEALIKRYPNTQPS